MWGVGSALPGPARVPVSWYQNGALSGVLSSLELPGEPGAPLYPTGHGLGRATAATSIGDGCEEESGLWTPPASQCSLVGHKEGGPLFFLGRRPRLAPTWEGCPGSAPRREGDFYIRGHRQWPHNVLSSVEEEMLPPLAKGPQNYLDRVGEPRPTLCRKVHFILRI